MRVVLQRVTGASVRVGDRLIGEVAQGYCLLVGFAEGDTAEEVRWMADKIAGLRIFGDEEGKMNLALTEVGGGVLVVSQFTLYGDVTKGRRPSFIRAAKPDAAIPLYERFVEELRKLGITVATGEFGAMMRVTIENDGPVTLLLEREGGERP